MTPTDPPRVLCVDDEPKILQGLERTLFESFDVTTASSGAEGLALLDAGERFDVILSDMRMPEMNGAMFLSEAKARAPRTVRVLLTGHAEVDAAVDAVNRGNIFRFLCKPCPPAELIATLRDAAALHGALELEHELLSTTLMASVRSMVSVLDLVVPTMGRRATVLASYATHACAALGIDDAWLYETSALLSQIGRVTLPGELIDRLSARMPLSDLDNEMVRRSYLTAAALVGEIPRLERVAAILRGLGGELPADADSEVQRGVELIAAIEALEVAKGRQRHLDSRPAAVPVHLWRALREHLPQADKEATLRTLPLDELRAGMILHQDACARSGATIARAGQELSIALIERLRNFDRSMGVVQPLHVSV